MNWQNRIKIFPEIWQVAFACFILAGITGTFYRLGIVGWLPWDLSLQNIRHAHSHLMFFGWAVPLPLYIFLTKIAADTGTNKTAIRWMRRSLWGCLFFGILSYPFFLFFGYHSVEIGAFTMPLSVIMSGMVMITWYLFIGSYLAVRNKLESRINPWYEASLVMLFISSLGAWGVALIQYIDPVNQLFMKALTHFFLAVFTEGWVLLAVLAILFDALSLKDRDLLLSPGVLIGMIAVGAPLTFPYGISESLLNPMLLNSARFGGLIIAVALFILLYGFLKSGKWKTSIWIWPLGLILIKALMQLSTSILPSEFWLADHALRILYLHVLLLGILTLGCVGWMHQQTGVAGKSYTLLASAVMVVLVSLFLMTRFWPEDWSGMWIFYLATGATLLPVLALGLEWIKLNSLNKT